MNENGTYDGYLIMVDPNLVLCTNSIETGQSMNTADYYLIELSKVKDSSEAIITWVDNISEYIASIKMNKKLFKFIEENIDLNNAWMLKIEVNKDGNIFI